MTIKQNGGIFGRNPTFNEVDATDITTESLSLLKNNPFVRLDDSDTDNNGEFRLDNTSVRIEADKDNAVAGSKIKFKIDNSEIGFFDENGHLDIDGNLVVASGQGIDFSATSGTGTSELLDDYEEGTWTPVVSDATSGGNTASGTFNGDYTKIGNAVTVNGSLVNINTSGMTSGNTLRIQGLPYLAYNFSGTRRHIGSVFLDGSISFTSGGFVQAWIGDNTQYVSFVVNTNGSGNDNLEVGDLTSGSSDIFFSLTYYA